MKLSRETKGYLAGFAIFAVFVFIGFVQINNLQEDAAHRELVQQSTRYDNCVQSNIQKVAAKEANQSLVIAITGLSKNPQHSEETNDALKKLVGFIENEQAKTKLTKCYKPNGYIHVP